MGFTKIPDIVDKNVAASGAQLPDVVGKHSRTAVCRCEIKIRPRSNIMDNFKHRGALTAAGTPLWP